MPNLLPFFSVRPGRPVLDLLGRCDTAQRRTTQVHDGCCSFTFSKQYLLAAVSASIATSALSQSLSTQQIEQLRNPDDSLILSLSSCEPTHRLTTLCSTWHQPIRETTARLTIGRKANGSLRKAAKDPLTIAAQACARRRCALKAVNEGQSCSMRTTAVARGRGLQHENALNPRDGGQCGEALAIRV